MNITIGVPTHNEENSIIKCLKSCVEQTLPPNEIIVVASGCTDKTVDKIRSFQTRNNIVKLITEEKRNGKISALNKILDSASGDIIIHTDGDVILEANVVELLSKYFMKYSFISAVSGRPKLIKNNSELFYRWAVKTENILMNIKMEEFHKRKFFHICGYIFAHRNNDISSVPFVKGATDATMGSILSKKGTIVFDPNIIAKVKHPNNVDDFIKQKARIRYGFLSLNSKQDSIRKPISELIFLKEIFKSNTFPINFGFLFILILYLASWIKAYIWLANEAELEDLIYQKIEKEII